MITEIKGCDLPLEANKMTITELRSNENYFDHHTGSRRGYESRKGEGRIEEYNGKFGNGYIHIQPRFDTTQYVYVTYYIKKES